MPLLRTACLLTLALLLSAVLHAEGPPPAKVAVAQVTEEEVAETTSFIGFLAFDRISSLSSEVSAMVDAVTVKEGDHVEQGAPLVRLNTELLDTDIELAKIRVDQAALQVAYSTKDFERQKDLLASKGASQKKYDDAQFALNNARIEQQAHEQQLARLRLEKRKSTIVAPYDGVILEKHVDTGDWVQQGRQVLTIGADDELLVKVPVGEQVLRHLAPGQAVPLTLNAFDLELIGTIDDLEPRADLQTKTVFVKIRIPRVERAAENMSVTAHLASSSRKLLRIIPRDSLVKFQGKDFVYSVKDGKAAIMPVNIVTFLGDRVATDTPFIVAGMPVVVEGNERLRPDQPVTVAGGDA